MDVNDPGGHCARLSEIVFLYTDARYTYRLRYRSRRAQLTARPSDHMFARRVLVGDSRRWPTVADRGAA